MTTETIKEEMDKQSGSGESQDVSEYLGVPVTTLYHGATSATGP